MIHTVNMSQSQVRTKSVSHMSTLRAHMLVNNPSPSPGLVPTPMVCSSQFLLRLKRTAAGSTDGGI